MAVSKWAPPILKFPKLSSINLAFQGRQSAGTEDDFCFSFLIN